MAAHTRLRIWGEITVACRFESDHPHKCFMQWIKYHIEKEILLLDAKTSLKELAFETFINFIYGFVANIVTVFIIMGNYPLMFFGFIMYYTFVSIVLNRDKYESKLGKYIIFPLGASLGALLGIWIAFKLKTLM